MNFLRQGLLLATTALLLSALGFAQSGVTEPDQYGTNVFRTAGGDQRGTDVFQTTGGDQRGTDVFQTAGGDQYGNGVFQAADRDQYGNDIYHTANRDQHAIDVFQKTGSDQYGSNVFQTSGPQFMREATQDAMAKINIARLALQNAQNEQVRAFAQQILSDYGKTQRDLFNIAYQQIVLLPDTLDPKHLDTFESLSQLHGAAFDQAYMKAMLNENRAATSRFKQEAAKGDNWASQTLPTLESNLNEAQKVALAVGVHSTVTSEEQRIPSAGKDVNPVSQKP
jgi:putative membrane protein